MKIDASDVVVHGRFWRFVQFPLTRIIIATVALAVTVLLLQWIAAVTQFKPHSIIDGALATVVTIAALIAMYVAYLGLVERRPASEFGMRRSAPEFAAGFLLGGGLFCLIMLILWLAGVARIESGAGWSALWLLLFGALELGVLQTLFFYGIVFRIAEQSLGTWTALAITIVAFGVAHTGGPGATPISIATIGLQAGSLFAAVYVYTRRLWMPIGLFTAWNFVEDGVFGVSASGHTEQGVLVSRFHGPSILSGGAAGPEVTIVAFSVCVMAAVVLFLLAIRRRHIVGPFRRERAGIDEAAVAAS